ncbi:MAG: hypothetical protein CBB92_11355 [Flammeovirgaceae bacterium TMED32]|nr:MAG: hypothetical protein CBB92_11355 [Flammeovirgaceae bacterium TMED32]
MNFPSKALLALLASLLSSSLMSFEIFGNKWTGAEASIYLNLLGQSASGVSWNQAFIQSVMEWNEYTDFNFNVVSEYRDPCVKDGLNGVAFLRDMCGESFGESAIAVTVLRYQSQLLGPAAIVEADIFINDNVDFDIYSGRVMAQRSSGNQTVDFRRTVLHELGHVIGLDHETKNAAIMQPKYGDIDRIQEDDILGVNSLYGGLKRCVIRELRLGLTADNLGLGDCTVQQLTSGGTDDSLVDIYQFSLKTQTDLQFDVTSNQLESVIILTDSNLRSLASDYDISDGCDANLTSKLQPGNYFLLVNTYDNQVKSQCGTKGNYRLSVNYEGQSGQSLGSAVGSLGGKSNTIFEGQISADGGSRFASRFSPNESLEASVIITLDPTHVGRSGFLMAVARIGEEILVLNNREKFVNLSSTSERFTPFVSKILGLKETIAIAKGLIPQDLGVDNIEVEFFVGYGLTESPNEIYYHQTPLVLSIRD